MRAGHATGPDKEQKVAKVTRLHPTGAGGGDGRSAPPGNKRPPGASRAVEFFVRTVALYATFLVAASICARMGDAQIGAHQIAFQLFVFLALVLDAVAIAGQVIVGRLLGAGDADGAFSAAVRMIGWSVVVARLLHFPDGTTREEKRKVTYKPKTRRVEVHPCRVPRGEPGYTGERCPDPPAEEEADAPLAVP